MSDAASAPSDNSGNLAAQISVSAWLDRQIELPDFLLGELLSTTSRVLLIGPTGLGKTLFAMELAFALAQGRPFLHWRAGRPCRVLYIDGEMPGRLIKERLAGAVARWGAAPDGLFVLARDDIEEMPPLNTPAGQRFVDDFIALLGGVDFVVFDNIQALLNGNMKEEDAWQEVQPWLLKLTRKRIGQLWIHHTGHDEGHGYGTKTREWQMGTVILMRRVERPEADATFKIEFTKTRERTPQNRRDFEPVVATLSGDKWSAERVTNRAAQPAAHNRLLTLLDRALQKEGVVVQDHAIIPPGTRCVEEQVLRETWIAAERERDPHLKRGSATTSFGRAREKLVADGAVGRSGPWLWIKPDTDTKTDICADIHPL